MKTLQGFPVVDENYVRPPGFEQHGTGYVERDYAAWPLNGKAYNRAPSVAKLSKAEIVELIKEKTAKKTWVTDLADRVGSHVKNQSQSPYCWIHAPTRGMEYSRIHQGGTLLTLSAFCGAWPIKHGNKSGGSGVEGVHSLAKNGTCIETDWPSMQFQPPKSDDWKTNAPLHQVTIAEEFEAGDYESIWSSIVQDQPVTVGIPAWGHEVLLTFLVLNGSDIAEGFDNSWGSSWGSNGRGVLAGAKRHFDEAMRIAAIEQSVA